MQDGSLSFIIPVRHQATVSDWATLKRHLSTTLNAVAAQTVSSWRCVVVANYGADLPAMPSGCEVTWVDLPMPSVPNPSVDRPGFESAVREDKGLRLLAGIQHLLPQGHVMMVDSDDWVAPNLAEFVAANPVANGWYVDTGYLYSGGSILYRYPREFYMFCGTSHIIRADLLLDKGGAGDFDIETVKMRLGSHIFIKKYLDNEGTPLRPLPFIGAVYRVGHANSDSKSKALISHLFPVRLVIAHPRETLRRLGRLRLAGSSAIDLRGQ